MQKYFLLFETIREADTFIMHYAFSILHSRKY